MTLLRSVTLTLGSCFAGSCAASASSRPRSSCELGAVMPSMRRRRRCCRRRSCPRPRARLGGVDRVGERRGEPARRHDHEQVPGRREAARPAAQRAGQLVEPADVGRARQRVDEPALVVAHLDEAELVDVARDGRLHGLDARRRASASATSACVESGRCWTRRRIVPCRSNFVVMRAPRRAARRASSASSAESVSGGVRRSVLLAGAADHEAVLERLLRRPARPGGRARPRAAGRGREPRRSARAQS